MVFFIEVKVSFTKDFKRLYCVIAIEGRNKILLLHNISENRCQRLENLIPNSDSQQ